MAAGMVWSNCRLVGGITPTPLGRVLAWQSTQEVGCGKPAAVKEAWNRAGVVPVRLNAQDADMPEGAAWQTPQSWGTANVVVGLPLLQSTASCFISLEPGFRAGFVAVGPTKPVGSEVAWQSPHTDGCCRFMLASDAWKSPG